MKEITITAEHEYSVKFTEFWREELTSILQNYANHLVLAPESLKRELALESIPGIGRNIHYLPEGESQKDISVLTRLWDLAGELNLNRDSVVVGVGGGATTDLAGFFAATWLRGVDWHAISTSLAGMVDAAIGGKTGINSAAGKNLVGSFHSPRSVIINSKFLETLPERDVRAGLAEVVKCGFIADPEILPLLRDYAANIDELVYRAIAVKAKVVNADFKESHLREILNYGHTLGHAIEKREKYSLRHGEAVSIGMIFAAELSVALAALAPDILASHREILSNLDLPISYEAGAFLDLIALMENDKKRRANTLRFIGIAKIGEPIWLEDITLAELKAAYERISS